MKNNSLWLPLNWIEFCILIVKKLKEAELKYLKYKYSCEEAII